MSAPTKQKKTVKASEDATPTLAPANATTATAEPRKRERVFSGIQPSGTPHIGNYLGAIRHWVAEQDAYDNIFCVVNLHAITVPQDPDELRVNTRRLAAMLFACGIDPERSALFVQSQIAEHAELTWILDCMTPMGWLNRMTQFKTKAGRTRDRQRGPLHVSGADGSRYLALSGRCRAGRRRSAPTCRAGARHRQQLQSS